MPDVPFAARVLAVLVLMALGAAVDVRRHGREATRPREYALLLAGGAIGAAFALGCDAVTSALSPAFFVHGKGIDEGPGFTRGVVELALQAGTFAGVVVLGALLVASQPSATRRALAPAEALVLALRPLAGAPDSGASSGFGRLRPPRPSCRARLCSRARRAKSALAGLLVAPLGGLLARALDPLGLARDLRGVIDPGAVERFVLVWGLHAGLYAGALVGLASAVITTRRRTRVVIVPPGR